MLGGAPGLFPYLPALESRLLSASATEVGQDLWTWCPLPPAERTHSPVGLLSVFGRERLENSLDAGRNWDDWGKLLVGFGASSDTQQGEMARWAMVYEGAKWHRSDLVSFRKSRLGGSQPLLLLPAKPPVPWGSHSAPAWGDVGHVMENFGAPGSPLRSAAPAPLGDSLAPAAPSEPAPAPSALVENSLALKLPFRARVKGDLGGKREGGWEGKTLGNLTHGCHPPLPGITVS